MGLLHPLTLKKESPMPLIKFLGAFFALLIIAVPTWAQNAPQLSSEEVSPTEAAKKMTLPNGFQVKVFAAEPDVVQPFCFCFDERGRMWVAENLNYRTRGMNEDEPLSRISIYEDTSGDGVFDKKKIFIDNVFFPSGIEKGFGGIWIGSPPNLLFIPDRDGDDVPDGAPEVVLDGWGMHDRHETLNSFTWGPDGWLYGCHGVFTHSNVGKPGASDEQRVKFNAGWWRYHPVKKQFELFAEGGSNQWGVGFDDNGQAFATACVIPHLWHVIHGGRYHRQAGPHTVPYVYDDIKTIAEHKHASAHGGARIYLADNFPKEYRNRLFMANIHQHAILTDVLERNGSGFVGRHGDDFCNANDNWFVGFNLEIGPEGGVYVIDWYDRDICGNALFSALTGRIYRFTYGDVKSPVGMNLALLSDEELVKLHLHPNDWYGRQARRILQERAAAGKLDGKTPAALTKLLDEHPETPRKLRALWTLHVTGGLKSDKLLQLLKHEDEYLRAWAIQLLVEDQTLSAEALGQFVTMAKTDVSPVVRLYLASALQRMPVAQRWEIVTALLDHAEDAGDHNLPLMVWYGFEPLVPADPARALAIAAAGSFKVVREHAGRRLAENDSEPNLVPLVQVIARFTDSQVRRDLLKGALDGLRGRKSLSSPMGWPELYPRLTEDANVFPHARALAVLFGDAQVLESFRKQLLSTTEPEKLRLEALDILIGKRVPDLAPTLQQLVNDPAIYRAAIRALAVYDDEQTPAVLLKRYADLKPEEKQDVIATLAGRKSYALALLDGVENKIVASGDISAFIARQLYSLGDKQVSERLKLVWGDVRESSQEKQDQIAQIKKMLTPGVMSRANLANGRVLFSKTCQQCHMLYGEGAKVGPDLTGSNRADMNYILSNIIEPSAEIGRDYKMTLILTTDGRTISGQIVEQTDTRLVMHTATEKDIVVSRTDIEEIRESPISMMPEGQLDKMKPDEIRDLVGYLATKKQVLPSSSPNQSRAGNQMGSIQDDDFSTFTVTYNGTAAENDWFAVPLNGAVTISNVVFGHGQNFHDGGWFDTSAGKPIVQVQSTRDGVWETVGELSDYPKTTVANNGGLKPGQKFICELKKPVKGVAVRVIGVPSSGDNPTQAFSSCSELQAK